MQCDPSKSAVAPASVVKRSTRRRKSRSSSGGSGSECKSRGIAVGRLEIVRWTRGGPAVSTLLRFR
jgi:hypothetical protein